MADLPDLSTLPCDALRALAPYVPIVIFALLGWNGIQWRRANRLQDQLDAHLREAAQHARDRARQWEQVVTAQLGLGNHRKNSDD